MQHSILDISPEAFVDYTSSTKALLDELHDRIISGIITRSFMKSPDGRPTDVRDLLMQIMGEGPVMYNPEDQRAKERPSQRTWSMAEAASARSRPPCAKSDRRSGIGTPARSLPRPNQNRRTPLRALQQGFTESLPSLLP